MSETKEKQEQNQSKPSPLTHLIVGLFSVVMGVFFKKKLREFSEKEGLSEREGCFALYAAMWLIGAVLLVLIWIGYLISRLF